jgi:hypothetical protein
MITRIQQYQSAEPATQSARLAPAQPLANVNLVLMETTVMDLIAINAVQGAKLALAQVPVIVWSAIPATLKM